MLDAGQSVSRWWCRDKFILVLFFAILCGTVELSTVTTAKAEDTTSSGKDNSSRFIQRRKWQTSRVAARGVQYFNGKLRASFGRRRGPWIELNHANNKLSSSLINRIGVQYRQGKLRVVFKQQTGEWIDLLRCSENSQSSLVNGQGVEYTAGRLRYVIASHYGDWIRLRRRDAVRRARPAPTDFPKQLAAYVLHTQYLFSATRNANDWYYGKKITISGLVDLKQITRIPSIMLVGKDYSGKFMIPMLGGRIKCLIAQKPPSLSPHKCYPRAVRSTKDSVGNRKIQIKYYPTPGKIKQQLFIVTCEGVLRKGGQYKTAVLVDAKVIGVREIKAQYKLKSKASGKDSSQAERVNITSLYKSNQLVKWGWLRIFFVSTRIGSILCRMGADPDDRGEELVWARRLARREFKRIETKVSISGVRISRSATDLDDCIITAWHIVQRQ